MTVFPIAMRATITDRPPGAGIIFASMPNLPSTLRAMVSMASTTPSSIAGSAPGKNTAEGAPRTFALLMGYFFAIAASPFGNGGINALLMVRTSGGIAAT